MTSQATEPVLSHRATSDQGDELGQASSTPGELQAPARARALATIQAVAGELQATATSEEELRRRWSSGDIFWSETHFDLGAIAGSSGVRFGNFFSVNRSTQRGLRVEEGELTPSPDREEKEVTPPRNLAIRDDDEPCPTKQTPISSSSKADLSVDQPWMRAYVESNTKLKTSAYGGRLEKDTCVACNKYERLSDLFECRVCNKKQHHHCRFKDSPIDQCNYCLQNIKRVSWKTLTPARMTGQGSKSASYKDKGMQIASKIHKNSWVPKGRGKHLNAPYQLIKSKKENKGESKIEVKIPKLSSSNSQNKSKEEAKINFQPSMDKASSSNQPRADQDPTNYVMQRLDHIENGMVRLEGRMVRLEGNITAMNGDVTERMDHIENGMVRLEGNITAMNGDVTEIRKQLAMVFEMLSKHLSAQNPPHQPQD